MKSIFTLILATVCMQMFAQIGVTPLPLPKTIDVSKPVPLHNKYQNQNPLNKTNAAQSGWFNYVDGLSNSGSGTIVASGGFILSNDSNPVYIYKDAGGLYKSSYISTHGLGMALDPKSTVWETGTANTTYFRMNRYTKYTLDSFSFTYAYSRYRSDNIDDTLVIQYYTSPSAAGGISKNFITGGTNTDTPNVAIINFDPSTDLGKLSLRTVKYQLNWKDTTENIYHVLRLAVSPALNIAASQIVGATVVYKPGVVTALSDTLTFDTTLIKTVAKKGNIFEMYMYKDNDQFLESNSKKTDPTPVIDRIWQNTELLISEVKYSIFTNWIGTYWPGDLYVGTHLQIDMDFHLNASNTGVATHVDNLKSLQVYPNPSNGSKVVNLEYVLTKSSNVSVEIVNILGKKLSSLSLGKKDAGTETTSINVSELADGIYFANIYVDGAVQTVKFTVSR